jgi:ribosomal-protein-alanine N-acetyltransferase
MIRPLTLHDCDRLSQIHSACFSIFWTTETFISYFSDDVWNGTFGLGDVSDRTNNTIDGFIIGRTCGDTNDILTIAVDPLKQGRGIGRALLRHYKQVLDMPIFLEVSCTNTPAVGLYESEGFAYVSKRLHYYPEKQGECSHAYVMCHTHNL